MNNPTFVNKAVLSFQRYAFKVVEILNKTDPKVRFHGRMIFTCYANNIPPKVAAKAISGVHRSKKSRR